MKVGLLCGREYSFPPAFVERVNEAGAPHGITAEMVKLGGTKMDAPAEYRVIVDRISHEVEYYRGALKHEAPRRHRGSTSACSSCRSPRRRFHDSRGSA